MIMKKLILLAVLLITVSIVTAQVVSDRSNVQRINMELEYKLEKLPNLFYEIDVVFENDFLSAGEKGMVILEIINKGDGPAQGIEIQITPEEKDEHLIIGDKVYIPRLSAGTSRTIRIPIEATLSVETKKHSTTITAMEHFGFDMAPIPFEFHTLEYQESDIQFVYMDIFDTGEGTQAIIPDGQLQPGEQIRVKMVIQNTGSNTARDIKYKLETTDNNIFIRDNTDKGVISDMNIGDVHEIWATIAVNRRVDYKENEYLPIFLTINEEMGFGCIEKHQLPLALGQRPPQAEILAITPDIEGFKKSLTYNLVLESERISQRETSKSVDVVPTSRTRRENAIAVIIGVEEYEHMPNAPYAKRDAEIMQRYFENVIGINRQNIFMFTNNEVRGHFFVDWFDPNYGQLMRRVTPEETDVFVYYSGHGVPDKDGEENYLFPADGRLELIEARGYNINNFYDDLNNIDAKSVTIIMDACFTGSTRPTAYFDEENYLGIRGLRYTPPVIQPWETNPNFRVFTSSTGIQTSLGFDESQTGLFTYWLAIGLQGEADLNGDGVIMASELVQFLQEKVPQSSRRIRGEQNPQFFGSEDFIIAEF